MSKHKKYRTKCRNCGKRVKLLLIETRTGKKLRCRNCLTEIKIRDYPRIKLLGKRRKQNQKHHRKKYI